MLAVKHDRATDAPGQARPEQPALSGDTDVYLHRLGERVRMLRNQRGMSRKVLATTRTSRNGIWRNWRRASAIVRSCCCGASRAPSACR